MTCQPLLLITHEYNENSKIGWKQTVSTSLSMFFIIILRYIMKPRTLAFYIYSTKTETNLQRISVTDSVLQSYNSN